MKVKCQRDSLLNACQLVGTAVAARTTKPILSNIKAIAHDDALTLMATDLEIGIRYELRGVDVNRGGAAILPAGKLISILRESNDAEITLDADSERHGHPHEHGPVQHAGRRPGEFPDMPAFDDAASTTRSPPACCGR